jgi:hypothetical protein
LKIRISFGTCAVQESSGSTLTKEFSAPLTTVAQEYSFTRFYFQYLLQPFR